MLIMVTVLRIIVSVSRDMLPMEQNVLKVKYVVFCVSTEVKSSEKLIL